MTADTPPSAARGAWIRCVALGAAVLVCSLAVFAMFPATGGDFEPGYGSPVYAFEMAQSTEDLWRVFGVPTEPEHEARVLAMDRGNRWDYLFMALYGAFIVSFFAAAQRQRPNPLWRVGMFLGVWAAISDAVENVILLGLTKDLARAPYLEWLPLPVWSKFGCLVAAAALAGWCIYTEARGARWKVAGAVTLASAVACLLGAAAPNRFGWVIGSGIGLCWLIKLAFAATSAIPPARRTLPRE